MIGLKTEGQIAFLDFSATIENTKQEAITSKKNKLEEKNKRRGITSQRSDQIERKFVLMMTQR